jgi:pimeloyl-ACP methyl ester carboxylesterase/ribosomal protein S18 acetylase RimI-like enzyme
MSPIVFLPGAGGRSAFWSPVAERLADLGPARSFDWPGFGGAPPDPTIRSTDDLFSWLLSQLPPGPSHVVAQSMGGVLAVRLAIEHPERVDRLVLVATSGGVDLRQSGAADWRPEYLEDLPDVPRWFVEDRTDLTARLGEVRAPTLLVWSDADPVSPVTVGRLLEERIRGASLTIVSGGSHAFAQERPDEVAAAIRAHLTGVASAPAPVVPWSSLPELAPVAALLRRAPEDLALDLATLPAGAEGLAVLEGLLPAAVGLLVRSDVNATGRASLAWLSIGPAVPATRVLRLVEAAEQRARASGACVLEVVEKHAPGIASLLERRGYRAVNAVVRMRRASVRDPLPLPAGYSDASLEDAGLDAWVEVANAAFVGVPFNAPLSRGDLERLVGQPRFDPTLVRLVRDDLGTVGFLHGTIARDGTGEVESIGVVDRAKRLGLGRWLLRRCEQLLDERGARAIALRVAESNEAALALYRREGYVEVARSVAWERAL